MSADIVSECLWCGEPIDILEEDADNLTFCSVECVNLYCEDHGLEPAEVH